MHIKILHGLTLFDVLFDLILGLSENLIGESYLIQPVVLINSESFVGSIDFCGEGNVVAVEQVQSVGVQQVDCLIDFP